MTHSRLINAGMDAERAAREASAEALINSRLEQEAGALRRKISAAIGKNEKTEREIAELVCEYLYDQEYGKPSQLASDLGVSVEQIRDWASMALVNRYADEHGTVPARDRGIGKVLASSLPDGVKGYARLADDTFAQRCTLFTELINRGESNTMTTARAAVKAASDGFETIADRDAEQAAEESESVEPSGKSDAVKLEEAITRALRIFENLDADDAKTASARIREAFTMKAWNKAQA